MICQIKSLDSNFIVSRLILVYVCWRVPLQNLLELNETLLKVNHWMEICSLTCNRTIKDRYKYLLSVVGGMKAFAELTTYNLD